MDAAEPALAPIEAQERALSRLTDPYPWMRDFALVGGVTSFVAPYVMSGQLSPYVVSAAVAGTVTGALLGLMARPTVSLLRRVPIPLLLGLGVGVGALWGATVGVMAALGGGEDVVVSALCAGSHGAIQFGWLWFPYLLLRARRRPTWPVVALALLGSPFVTVAGVTLFMAAFVGAL